MDKEAQRKKTIEQLIQFQGQIDTLQPHKASKEELTDLLDTHESLQEIIPLASQFQILSPEESTYWSAYFSLERIDAFKKALSKIQYEEEQENLKLEIGDYIDEETAYYLVRKEFNLKLRALIYQQATEPKKIISKVENLGIDVFGSFLKTFALEEFKAVLMFLGWPVILPLKIVNRLASWTGSVVNKLGILIENYIEEPAWACIPKGRESGPLALLKYRCMGLLPLGIPWVASFARKTCTVGAAIMKWVTPDVDKWILKSPNTAGFLAGMGLGFVVLTSILASIFSLGIPIVAMAGGLAVASVAAAGVAGCKACKRSSELSEFRLNPEDQERLDDFKNAFPETYVSILRLEKDSEKCKQLEQRVRVLLGIAQTEAESVVPGLEASTAPTAQAPKPMRLLGLESQQHMTAAYSGFQGKAKANRASDEERKQEQARPTEVVLAVRNAAT
ncbi:MAG: hypothetical protein ACKOAD_08665 [Gammaproteobacteria bacterium]